MGAVEGSVDSVAVQSVDQSGEKASIPACAEVKTPVDSFLSPLEIDERNDRVGARASVSSDRCSDKGFLAMPVVA